MVTDAQVRLMRQTRMNGKTQAAAAAASSMSLRTAREWDSGPMPTTTKRPRDWRTRPDPFAAVWQTDVEPLLRSDLKGVLEAKVVLEVLRQRYPEQFQPGQARTLKRRFRDWRARHGVEPEVFFQRVAVPGREAAIDFTHGTDLGVTVAGEVLPHLLFEFVLSYSHWTWVAVAFGETFEALVAGVQGALWALGGAPAVLSLLRWYLGLQLLEPVEHDLNLRSGGRTGRGVLSRRDDAEESLAVERDVVVSLETWAAFKKTLRHRHRVAEDECRPRRHAHRDELAVCRIVEQLLPVGRPRGMDAAGLRDLIRRPGRGKRLDE
jgi:hypothetical protein